MVVDNDGNEVVGPIPFPLKARNTMWLYLVERDGTSVPEIAAAWRVSVRTVREGIKRARHSRDGKPPPAAHMNFDDD